MTDKELKALVAENSVAIRELRSGQRESERRWQESREETERLWQEIRASREESDRLLTSFNRQLGQLGNRLGDYTESLFRPSLDRVLRERFGMTVVTAPQRVWENGDYYEFDMVGHAGNTSDEVYLVEIKSKLRDDSIEQLVDQLRRFPRLFPEHRGKKLYGILAALEIPAQQRAKVLRGGFFLATIRDDIFEIIPPGDGFEPRAFGLRGLS